MSARLLSGGGVQSTALGYCVQQSMIQLSCNGNATIQHLGTWTAPINGHMLKLNYVACQYFNTNSSISQSGNPAATGPTVIDLTILFFTSNTSGEYCIIPGSNVKLYGYGYGISTHCTAMPYALYVSTTNTQLNPTSQTFDFYVTTGPFVGCAMISAMTTDTWTPEPGITNHGGIVDSVPSANLRLPIASNMTTMCQNYVTRQE